MKMSIKRIICIVLAIVINFSAFAAELCPTKGSDVHVINGTPVADPMIVAESYAATILIEPDTTALDGIWGTNASRGQDGYWITGGFNTALGDSATGSRAKALRFFGGERMVYKTSYGDSYTTTGSYLAGGAPGLISHYHNYNDTNEMGYKAEVSP